MGFLGVNGSVPHWVVWWEDGSVRGVALSAGEREEISRGLAAGLSGRAIGRLLGRDGSVINKEIARCGGREAYRAQVAQRRAVRQRARPKLRTVEACPRLARLVSDGLARGWSPRQISGRLAREYPAGQTGRCRPRRSTGPCTARPADN